jgi:SAM-dependent methyltransferase
MSEQLKCVIQSTVDHDMMTHVDEPYYMEQYLFWIVRAMERAGSSTSGDCLDLGCGQGRLSIPLGRIFDRMRILGVDVSEQAVEKAIGYGSNMGVTNVQFKVSTIEAAVSSLPRASFQLVLMTEVTFFYPDWEKLFPEMVALLAPGGILGISFRPLYFDALHIVDSKSGDLNMLLSKRRGRVFGGSVEFTWQTSAEVRRLINDAGLALLDLAGIGCCSGIEGDPHAKLVRPSQLSESGRKALMQLEIEIGKDLPDAGRYMLALARKPLAQ